MCTGSRFIHCLGLSVSESESEEVPVEEVGREPVIVNVYDLSAINAYTLPIGLGAFHTGIEVYGREYCYGHHECSSSGIFYMTPRSCAEMGDNIRFRQSITIGYTKYTRHEVFEIVREMRFKYRGNQYSLMQRNCNHFADDFALLLCGKHIPKWVNRLARFAWCLNRITQRIPRRWLTYGR